MSKLVTAIFKCTNFYKYPIGEWEILNFVWVFTTLIAVISGGVLFWLIILISLTTAVVEYLLDNGRTDVLQKYNNKFVKHHRTNKSVSFTNALLQNTYAIPTSVRLKVTRFNYKRGGFLADILLAVPRFKTTTSYVWIQISNLLKSPLAVVKWGNWSVNWRIQIRICFNNLRFFLHIIVDNMKLLGLQTTSYGFIYVKTLVLVFFIDAILTDDEPLWEPIEWSLIQYWLIFIFMFSWIAENLITSRYGSYTGRDKRVWFAWYKTFWFVEGYYALTMGSVALFVITPFYHEVNYITPFMMSWWDWYSRTFFFKFIGIYTLILLCANYMQVTLSQSHWKKSLIIIIIINIFLAYLLYTQFIITFFVYFTDPNWYAQTRLIDYVQLSHEPHKWSWGSAKRDHFSYHNSKTVFWFKNDGPFASAMLFFNILLFLTLFTLHIYWLALMRRVYATKEITFTYTTSCVAALRQFGLLFSLIFSLTFVSLLTIYWRLPVEFYSINIGENWFKICIEVIETYLNSHL